MIYDIIIIGAGASGLFAASNIKPKSDIRGLILNKAGRPGLKLLMSGAGQCNVTRAGDIRDFADHYGQNGKKIRSVLYNFTNEDTVEWFSSRSVPMMTRSDGKIFPKSMNARDILDILLKKSSENGFSVKNNMPVTKIMTDADKGNFTVVCETAPDRSETFLCRNLIIACGGASYPTTGSDGSIFPALSDLGIQIKTPVPSLVPLNVENYPYAELSGNSVKNAEVSIQTKNVQKKKDMPAKYGDVLFTHKNFSGPAVLDMSRYAPDGSQLVINWLPSSSASETIDALNKMRPGCRKKTITVLNDYFAHTGLSESFIRLLCSRTDINPDSRFSDISNNALKALSSKIFEDRFTVSGNSGFKTAMATSGGVELSEIDLKTMQSKKYPGLYIIGETTDIDGDTGGYNLQFAFSSAIRAAESLNDKYNK